MAKDTPIIVHGGTKMATVELRSVAIKSTISEANVPHTDTVTRTFTSIKVIDLTGELPPCNMKATDNWRIEID